MKTTFLSLVAILALATSTAFADLNGPAYPPPGGVTFAASGPGSGVSGGKTYHYSALDPLAFSELYWTFTQIDNPWHSSQGASTGQMTFVGYNAGSGIATWESSGNMTWSTAFGSQSVATELLVQCQPYTGIHDGQLGSGWLVPIDAATAGISTLPSSWSVLDVAAVADPTDNYQVWFRYQTAGGSPLLTYYDSSNSLGGSVNTSASGGFYDVVPEPTSLVLLAIGGAALLARRHPRSLANERTLSH